MPTLTPLLTTTPSNPPTYNVGIAEAYSWVPIQGAGRPLYARATYLANASDMSVSLSANNLNIDLENTENLLKAQLGQQGFDFIIGGQTASSGPYTTVQIVSAARISSISSTNSTIGALTAADLPQNFTFYGPIQNITLAYGSAFVYKL